MDSAVWANGRAAIRGHYGTVEMPEISRHNALHERD